MVNRFACPLTFSLALTVALLTGEASWASCDTQMSRLPVSAPAARPAPALRAAMVRQALRPKAGPAAPAAVTARAVKSKVRKARRMAASHAQHRPHRKRPVQTERAAVRPPSGPAPTPMAIAARALAEPAAFALISSTTCVNGPADGGRLYSLRAPSLAAIPEAGTDPPAPEPEEPPGVTFLPQPSPSGGLGPGLAPPGGPPLVGPPPTQPAVEPPPLVPPLVPPVAPELNRPPPVNPPEPPLGPPGPPTVGPPTLLPELPVNPPTPRPPLTPGAVPEPSTWVMLIAGFGLVGARARRRRGAADLATSRLRARGPGGAA